MNTDSKNGSGETDTTGCICGARSVLVGTFTDRTVLSSADGKRAREFAIEPRGGVRTHIHGVERFVCQGAYVADMSLYEIDVVFEEHGRVGVVWLCGRKRCGLWVDERRHGRGENKVKVRLRDGMHH
jgi:hypothetical protein